MWLWGLLIAILAGYVIYRKIKNFIDINEHIQEIIVAIQKIGYGLVGGVASLYLLSISPIFILLTLFCVWTFLTGRSTLKDYITLEILNKFIKDIVIWTAVFLIGLIIIGNGVEPTHTHYTIGDNVKVVKIGYVRQKPTYGKRIGLAKVGEHFNIMEIKEGFYRVEGNYDKFVSYVDGPTIIEFGEFWIGRSLVKKE